MEDDPHQQRSALLNMSVDEIYSSIQRKKRRPGRWTMPGRLTLPEFGIEPYVPPFLKVTCARCGAAFLVEHSEWLTSSEYQARPCPYCFRVGTIPERVWRMRNEH